MTPTTPKECGLSLNSVSNVIVRSTLTEHNKLCKALPFDNE